MNPKPPQPSPAPAISSNAVQEQLAFPSIPLHQLIKPAPTLDEKARLAAVIDTPLAVTTPECAAQACSTRGSSSRRGRPLARRRAGGRRSGCGRGKRTKKMLLRIRKAGEFNLSPNSRLTMWSCCPTFALTCTEFLRFADTLRQSDKSVEASPAIVVNENEVSQLCELARKRKRNRLALLTVWRECNCAQMFTDIDKSR